MNKFDKYQLTFPLKKDLGKIILDNNKNITELNKVVHPLVRKEINFFYKKNKYKKIVVLDIPLLLENNIFDKNFILVFVDSNKKQILKRLKKRKNYNSKIFKILQKIQLPVEFKRKKKDYIIKNNFIKSSIKKNVKLLKKNLFNK